MSKLMAERNGLLMRVLVKQMSLNSGVSSLVSRTIRVTDNSSRSIPALSVQQCMSVKRQRDWISAEHNLFGSCGVTCSYTSVRGRHQSRSDSLPNEGTQRVTRLLRAIDIRNTHLGSNSYSQLQHYNNDKHRRLFIDDRDKRSLTLSAKEIVAASPSSLKPYLRMMRIDRPIGTWLVYLPCAWGISLAAPAGCFPDTQLLMLCGLGAFFMRGAGCTINDMWDKNFDAQVARTMDRPLASGEISRLRALVFLAMPLSASLAILLTLNTNTILLGMCSVIPCVIYPLMKRVTYWPQIFLGLTFNWGALMGWSAVYGNLHTAILPLYASCVAWTVVYDTIYAFQDKEDDLKIGLKSTALRFGDSTKYWLTGFTSAITAGLTTTGYLCDMTWPYYLGVAFFTGHLGRQIYSVDLTNPEDCGNKFRSNRQLGIIFWATIVAATLLKNSDNNKRELQQE